MNNKHQELLILEYYDFLINFYFYVDESIEIKKKINKYRKQRKARPK